MMIQRNKRFISLFLTISFLLLYGLLPRNTYLNQATSLAHSGQEQTSVITIFVHGIISVKPHLSIGNIIKLMSDKVAGSSYEQAVSLIRNDPFFYQYHPMQHVGLQPIAMDRITPGDASAAFARAFDYLDRLQEKAYCSHYYTFGWSGLLSPSMRYLEAEMFYQALQQLIEKIRACNKQIKIRIVGYSHGGNVTLKLASIAENIADGKKIIIDELILIGVPILPDSYTLIHSPIFKKIYHFYSLADRIQNLDCFSFNRFFSERTFRSKANTIDLPNKLVQIRLDIRRPKHNKPHDTVPLSRLQSRDVSPGHSEFYSFGWTHANFRSYHPFHPLPTAVFAPYLINQLHAHNIESGLVTMEVHPYHETLIIKQMKNKIHTKFLSHEHLNALKNDAHQFKPRGYNGQEYYQRVQAAIQQGKKIIKHKQVASCARKQKKSRR